MISDPKLSQLYNVAQAMEKLKCSKAYVHELVKLYGRIQAYPIAKNTTMYLKADVDKEVKRKWKKYLLK